MENKNKDKNKNIERYKDPLGLTPKKMDFGLWYVKHRQLFKNILIVFLVIISISTWFLTIYTFTYYISKGMQEDEELVQEIINKLTPDHEYILQITPTSLKIGQVTILKRLEKFDLVASVENPSDEHWANFNYNFIINGSETKDLNGFILPGEKKIIKLLSLDKRITRAEIKINNVSWSRVNKHQILDWEAFRDEHLNMKISDIEFIQSQESGLSENLKLNTLEFDIKNNTPYNYWEVVLNIIFYRQGSIVGVDEYIISEFKSGQEKNIKRSIVGSIGNVNKIDIIPEINIIKKDIYMDF